MSNGILRDVGEALFGPRWQSDLARELKVTDRTMRRWLASDGDLPRGVALDLIRACDARILAINSVQDRLIEADF